MSSFIANEGEIIDVDIIIEQSKLKSIADNTLKYSLSKTRTKANKELIDMQVYHSSGSETSLLLGYDSIRDVVTIKPFKLKSRKFVDGPITIELIEVFERIAIECKGTLKAYDDNRYLHLIENGIRKEAELDIIEKGASKKFIDVDEDEESGVNVKITVMLKDFIDNNEEVIKLIKDCSTIVEQVNLIGKYLVSKKLNDSIDTETFKSLFYQCIIYGADDETLKKFYKILF